MGILVDGSRFVYFAVASSAIGLTRTSHVISRNTGKLSIDRYLFTSSFQLSN